MPSGKNSKKRPSSSSGISSPCTFPCFRIQFCKPVVLPECTGPDKINMLTTDFLKDKLNTRQAAEKDTPKGEKSRAFLLNAAMQEH